MEKVKVLVKLIVVNKGKSVTLKYLSVFIKMNIQHRLFIGPKPSIRLIYLVVK